MTSKEFVTSIFPNAYVTGCIGGYYYIFVDDSKDCINLCRNWKNSSVEAAWTDAEEAINHEIIRKLEK